MSHEVKFDETNEIVNVIYNGAVTLDERKKVVEKVSSLYSQMRPLPILVNVRELEMGLTMEEQKTFGEYLASHPKLIHARVAILHKESHNPSLFIDTHAYNNGFLLAQFSDDREALNWLRMKEK